MKSNCSSLRGFVKMSASWCLVSMNSMVTSWLVTWSHIKWCLISICFVLECCILAFYFNLKNKDVSVCLSLFQGSLGRALQVLGSTYEIKQFFFLLPCFLSLLLCLFFKYFFSMGWFFSKFILAVGVLSLLLVLFFVILFAQQFVHHPINHC